MCVCASLIFSFRHDELTGLDTEKVRVDVRFSFENETLGLGE